MRLKELVNVKNKPLMVAALLGGALLAASPAAGQETASPMIPPKGPAQMPNDVRQAWACVVGGTAGTASAVAAGAENLVNVVAGGVVAPSNRAVLIVGLTGVVFTTFCTFGQQLLPLIEYYNPWGATPDAPVGSETAGSGGRGGREPAPLTSSYQFINNASSAPTVFVEEIVPARF